MAVKAPQPIDIGISDDEVNIKHLVWQLREQQTALSDVAALRQEVLPLKLAYNAAKAELLISKENMEEMRELILKERSEREMVSSLQESLTRNLQQIRTQQEQVEELCLQMQGDEKSSATTSALQDGRLLQLEQRWENHMQVQKAQTEELQSLRAQLATQEAEVLRFRRDAATAAAAVAAVPRDELRSLREQLEQECSRRLASESHLQNETSLVRRDLQELKHHEGISDGRVKELEEKLDVFNTKAAEEYKALRSTEGSLSKLWEKEGASVAELHKSLQRLEGEMALQQERLE
ncbi:unnamed protein product, partial [Durusdinium trenchii]